MPSDSTGRRSLLKILGAVGVTCTYPFQSDELFGQTEAPRPDTNSPHHHSTIPIAHSSPEPRFFNAADFATISRIADLIIPQTDTPGALGAGVPAYIDLVISRNTNQQVVVADGLRWLDSQAVALGASAFTNLSEKQQLSILEPLCDAADLVPAGSIPHGRNVQFFALLKNLTADGYYTSRLGLVQELGYKGNTALANYPSCVPEH
jgi:hypothetical protein